MCLQTGFPVLCVHVLKLCISNQEELNTFRKTSIFFKQDFIIRYEQELFKDQFYALKNKPCPFSLRRIKGKPLNPFVHIIF